MGGHGKPPHWGVQLVTEIMSGVVNGLLMFVFCYVFASLVFGPEEVGLANYVPLGAGTNTISALVTGLAFALYSDCGVSIAGPDINPTIFFAQMSVKIREYVDEHYEDEDEQSARTLTTTLFTIMLGAAMTGLWFYTLGRFKLTRVVQFLPAAVLSGFLASVGVIIIVKAVKASVGDELSHHLDMWQFYALLAPAIPIGLLLYFSKRYHIGSPIVVIPVLLFGPFVLFYVAVFATGNDLVSVRTMNLCEPKGFECNWLYERFDAVLVTDQWARSYGQTDQIEWGAIASLIPDLLIMLIIVTLDSLLKISGTKKNLKISDLDYDHEMQLGGKANMLLVFLVGAPGYGQLKFNALNSGIIHNTTSRLPGIISALFNGGLFLAGFPLINYLPRFFVGALLIYAGLGFIVENLIDTWLQNRLSLFEYATVVAIVVLSQAASMLVAVVVGVMLSFVLFVIQYSKTGVIKAVLSGKDFQSSVIRSTQEDAKLEHLSAQVLIVKLKRYIFFGSASQITDLVRSLLAGSLGASSGGGDASSGGSMDDDARRVHTLVFDWEDVYGVDFTACGLLGELLTQLAEANENALEAEHELRRQQEDGEEHSANPADPEGGSSGGENADNNEGGGNARGEPAFQNGRQNHTGSCSSAPGSKRSRWTNNAVLHAIKAGVAPKRRPAAPKMFYTVVFTGMSDKVYRRLKTEGIIDLIHRTGVHPSQAGGASPVPETLTVPRKRRLAGYVSAILNRVSGRKKRQSGSGAAVKAKAYLDEARAMNHEDEAFLDGHGRPATTADYYLDPEFPAGQRRIFPTLDLAMEWVEERLLEQASRTREKWLSFAVSFQTLHEQARLKAQHEPFEHILGGHLGDQVWRYIQPIRVPEGAHLCTAGDINPHLFLLQHGRVTSYMVRTDDSLIRLQSHRRGAFINADALFVEYPLSHTVIADEDSVVLALSRENLKLLEARSPEVAFEIHRNVLRHTARVRNRLARELDVVDHWSLHERLGGGVDANYTDSVRHAGRTFSFYHSGGGYADHLNSSTATVSSNGSSNRGSHGPLLESFFVPPDRDCKTVERDPQELLIMPGSKQMSSSTQLTQPSGSVTLGSRANGSRASTQPGAAAPQAQQPQQLQGSGNEQPESHLKNPSRNLGRMIMDQSRMELNEEVARAETKAAKANAASAAAAGNGGDATDTRSKSSYAAVANETDAEDLPQAAADDSHLNLKSRRPSRAKKAMMAAMPASLLAAGAKSHVEDDVVALPRSASSSGSLRRSATDSIRSGRSSSGHRSAFGSTIQRNPSLCFRPDLQRNNFLHLPRREAESLVQIVDADEVRKHMHLSHAQNVDAVACLRRAVSNRFHGRGRKTPLSAGDSMPTSPTSAEASTPLHGLFGSQLPLERLRQTLMDMGHFPSDGELKAILSKRLPEGAVLVSEEQFLSIVRDLSLEQLEDDLVQGFALFFNKHAQDLEGDGTRHLRSEIPVLPDKVLTVGGLRKLMEDLLHPEDPRRLERIFAEWSDFSLPSEEGNAKPVRVLQFVSLCSMMAHHIKTEKLDEQVAEDFKHLTQEKSLDDIILAEDILDAMRAMRVPCTRKEADEMVFEADLSGIGGVAYNDLVETLTTVFESEIEPQLEQLTQDLIETGPHNMEQ